MWVDVAPPGWKYRSDGHNTGVDDDGGITPTNNTLWSFHAGSSIASSPTVVNGVVYFGCDDNKVYARNANTGAEIWNYTTGGMVQSSPAVVNGVVSVGSDDGLVYAINATTGAVIDTYAVNLTQSSPTVANGILYIGTDGYYVTAFNVSNGCQIWTYMTLGPIHSSPALAAASDNRRLHIAKTAFSRGHVHAGGWPQSSGIPHQCIIGISSGRAASAAADQKS